MVDGMGRNRSRDGCDENTLYKCMTFLNNKKLILKTFLNSYSLGRRCRIIWFKAVLNCSWEGQQEKKRQSYFVNYKTVLE